MTAAESLHHFIQSNESDVFIEVEGRPITLEHFFEQYNSHYSPHIDERTDGVIALEEGANKWGLELRLYMHHNPDTLRVSRTSTYRGEYPYRLNDRLIIEELFQYGYRIGLNTI